MSDAQLRTLERACRAGDPDALVQLRAAAKRAGTWWVWRRVVELEHVLPELAARCETPGPDPAEYFPQVKMGSGSCGHPTPLYRRRAAAPTVDQSHPIECKLCLRPQRPWDLLPVTSGWVTVPPLEGWVADGDGNVYPEGWFARYGVVDDPEDP